MLKADVQYSIQPQFKFNCDRKLEAISIAFRHLVAGGASWLDGFGMVPAAVELSVLVEVNEIDEQLLAD